jgi:hypothetical protein
MTSLAGSMNQKKGFLGEKSNSRCAILKIKQIKARQGNSHSMAQHFPVQLEIMCTHMLLLTQFFMPTAKPEENLRGLSLSSA